MKIDNGPPKLFLTAYVVDWNTVRNVYLKIALFLQVNLHSGVLARDVHGWALMQMRELHIQIV